MTEHIKVVCKVSRWRFLLDNAPWLGRLTEVGSDQIETLIEINIIPCEIADILKQSKSINLLVKMKSETSVLWKKTI